MPKHKQFWFKFNAEKWLSSAFIAESDLAVVGAFINLLARAQLTDDCMLPADEKLLKKLSGAESDEVWSVVWPQLKSQFKRKNGKLHNEVHSANFGEALNKYTKKCDSLGKARDAKQLKDSVHSPDHSPVMNPVINDRTENRELRTIEPTSNKHRQGTPKKLCDLLPYYDSETTTLYDEYRSWFSAEDWERSHGFYRLVYSLYPGIGDLMDSLRNQRDPEKCKAKDVQPVDSVGAVIRHVYTKWASQNGIRVPSDKELNSKGIQNDAQT